ncbi:acyltransferase [Mesobacillus foraminis]|uniref:acyltransferase family protein n=1 Tax=Mesobacillus foraminis TaxID=279826 RepID=UPI001BE7BAA9|nr:acyltransferase [Mesobacillus foraminis]MBT2758398.1 acyltransferase [Mesobacillus foraminis]
MTNIKLNYINYNSRASSVLHFLRFLAALVVFLFHFYVPLPGYQAVIVFFVLSGYFISATIFKSLQDNRWSWSNYLVNRVTRLWVVLIPSLVLTLIWAKSQFYFFGFDPKIANELSLINFVGNIFFLQGILVNNFGMNGPLWSLSYEFWYYILFPCAVLFIYSKKISIKIIHVLLFTLISLLVGPKIMLYFLIWLLGAIVPLISPLIINNKLYKSLLICFSIIARIISLFAYKFLSNSPQIVPDLFIGVSFALLIYLIISFYNNSFIIKNDYPELLASFSYTLYLVHYPVANFIFAWLASTLWPLEETPLAIKLLFAIAVFLYSWIVSLLTEKHTDKVRKGICSKLIIYTNLTYRKHNRQHNNPHL